MQGDFVRGVLSGGFCPGASVICHMAKVDNLDRRGF